MTVARRFFSLSLAKFMRHYLQIQAWMAIIFPVCCILRDGEIFIGYLCLCGDFFSELFVSNGTMLRGTRRIARAGGGWIGAEGRRYRYLIIAALTTERISIYQAKRRMRYRSNFEIICFALSITQTLVSLHSADTRSLSRLAIDSLR